MTGLAASFGGDVVLGSFIYGLVVELEDTLVLETSGETRKGSAPFETTRGGGRFKSVTVSGVGVHTETEKIAQESTA